MAAGRNFEALQLGSATRVVCVPRLKFHLVNVFKPTSLLNITEVISIRTVERKFTPLPGFFP